MTRLRGGGAASAYATFALAMPFKTEATDGYWVSGTRYATINLVPGYAYTRAGAKGEQNAALAVEQFAANVPGIPSGVGYLSRSAFTNLLLNAGQSASLATQSVTLPASAHTLSFIGTGSVALSGAFVGTLAGTDASNRVTLTFTPTAGAVTFTVTGSVTFSGLVAGPHAGPIIATGAATASTGADDLAVTSGVTDVDHILSCVVDFKEGTDTPYLIGLFVSGNTFTSVRRTGGTLNLNVILANVDVANVNASTGVTTGRCAAIICRRAGKWVLASRYNGVTTISLESAPGGFPGPTPILQPGQSAFGKLNGVTELITHRVGTFDNAALSAYLLELLP